MGKTLEYVLLLSNVLLILAAQELKDATSFDHEIEKDDNFTLAIKQFFPKDQQEVFNRKVRESGSPSSFQTRRRYQPPRGSGKSPTKTLGLQAYAVPDPIKARRRYPPTDQFSGFRKHGPFHNNGKGYRNYPPDYFRKWNYGRNRTSKLPYNYIPNNSLYRSNAEELEKNLNRKAYKDGRSARYNQARFSPKVCDPCNNVPWVPLLKVPNSYRQERTHLPTLHETPEHSFNFDFKAFASDTHNVLLPPVPLVPPLEPIYDGTISSSFGLPIGNIPTGHGLLAPINHLASKVNRYGANSIDYSNSIKFIPTQSLLDATQFPELSPVPIVPIHDSTQFYIHPTNLVPSTTNTLDVSNVVLTITENGPGGLKPPTPISPDSIKLHSVLGKDLRSESSSLVDFQSSFAHGNNFPPVQKPNLDFGRLEIVKSIPLVEYTSSVDYPLPGLLSSVVPSAPPGSLVNHPPNNHISQNLHDKSHNASEASYLVPPPVGKIESDTSFNSNKSGVLPFLNPPRKTDSDYQESVKASTVPRPLTSPSLSWLFSDHSVQPTTSTPKSIEMAAQQFASDTQEIASIVNNELRPVSPHPLPDTTNSDTSKTKKIQIIIPYTTKNKNSYDNNALESVQHQVFETAQPPVSVSTRENNSSSESATSSFSSSPDRVNHRLPQTNPLIDGSADHITFKTDGDTGLKYLSEMHHIIATNIRELLRDEIEKSQADQNYPLQNNIDNWTALEYSNHKTVEAKAPKEIITQALAVTSIPGNSISHLLLPSKKIPDEYFVTTPLPNYDEPKSVIYNATNSSVDSRPFTAKPYATTNIYYPTTGSTRSRETTQENHDRNYTEVTRGKVNNWGRLNENLVIPEARSQSRRVTETTTSSWSLFPSQSDTKKIQIVTPVSYTSTRNITTYKRTTRHIHTTSKPTTARRKFKISQALVNSTRLEKIGSNLTSLFNRTRLNNTTRKPEEKLNKTIESSLSSSSSFNVSLASSSDELIKFSNKSEQFSINDIFPFRNKELPWESRLNISQEIIRNNKQRKSLIKQVNLQKTKTSTGDSS